MTSAGMFGINRNPQQGRAVREGRESGLRLPRGGKTAGTWEMSPRRTSPLLCVRVQAGSRIQQAAPLGGITSTGIRSLFTKLATCLG